MQSNPYPINDRLSPLDGTSALILLSKKKPFLLTDPNTNKSLKRLIVDDVLPLFIDVLTAKPISSFSEKDTDRRRLVKRVQTLMNQNLKQPLTLTDLCQDIGQSQRSLYYAFKEVYGLPPMKYLKLLRLYGFRKALRNTDPFTTSMTQVATDWGFWHTGQLAADYKKLFGETPGKTFQKG